MEAELNRKRQYGPRERRRIFLFVCLFFCFFEVFLVNIFEHSQLFMDETYGQGTEAMFEHLYKTRNTSGSWM